MKNNINLIVLICGLAAVLVSCGGGSGMNVRTNNDINKRNGLDFYEQQSYLSATDWLSKAFARNPDDVEVYIALLDSWQQMGEISQVWRLLNQSSLQAPEVALIEAEISQANQSCEQAIGLIENVDPSFIVSDDWQKRYWELQAQCQNELNNYLVATQALIQLENFTYDDAEQQMLQNRIVKNLIQVSEEDLIFAIGDPAYDELTRGWLEAAYVNFGADGISGDSWLKQWSNHPAANYFLDMNKVSSQQKVAVLLPFSGRFSSVAKTIQKGMLTASLADSNHQNDLVFYDTGSQGENLSNAWYSAQENGANLIIGPLDKDSIAAAEMMPAPTVPVVLLNQSEGDGYFQFTLSPEGEAQQAAERMYKDGQKSVLIMAPNDEWGERMSQAFAQRMVDLGGQIVDNTYFQPKQHDFSAQLRQTLGLIESQLRAKNLQGFLNINLASEEVVRSDVDAIFLAARKDFARLMVPQLKFHHAANVPVYSTSHVFDGLINEQHNRDLEGLRFALSPIELQTSNLYEILPFDLNKVGGDKKLFALGYDAYQLVNRLEWMSRVNTGMIDGLTGKVNLGQNGQFNRGLLWAQYNNGSIVALPQ